MSDCAFSDDEEKVAKVVKKHSKSVLRMLNFYGKVVHFNCEKMTYDGKGKKVVRLPMGWQKLKRTPLYVGERKPKVHGVLTGKVNDITVFDFDAKEVYEEVIKKYVILKGCLTVSTKKGYHVYVKYDERFKQTSNDKTKIDIRNDGGFVYGMGTKSEDGSKYRLYIDGVMDMEAPLDFYEEYFGKVEKKEDVIKSKKGIDGKGNKKKSDGKENKKEYVNNNTMTTKEKIIDLIDKKYLNDYSTWAKIIWSGKNSGISKEKLIEISMKSNKFDENGFDKVYEYSYPSFTYGTIKYYARLSNVKGYVKILNSDFINNPEEYTDMFLAKVIVNLCVDTFVYKDKDLYTYYNNRWRNDNTSAFMKKIGKNILDEYVDDMLVSINVDILNEMTKMDGGRKDILDKLGIQHKKILKLRTEISKGNFMNNICKELIDELICYYVDCEIEFDERPEIFCFNDKAYNILTGEEYVVSKEDYIIQNTGYEYIEPTEKEYNKVKEIFEEIFPDEEICKCYQSILLRGMTGYREEGFFLATGNGRNGKGVINELYCELLGSDYAYKLPVDVLTSKKDLASGANPQVASMHNKRFIFSSEPDTDDSFTDKLRMARIKDITGGKEFNARMLHSNICKVKMKQVQLLECNQLPKIAGKIDDSVIERIVVVPFVSTFTKRKDEIDASKNIYAVNKHYKTTEFQHPHRTALFKYLMNEAPKDIYLPEKISNYSKEYVCESDDFLVWFNDNYEKGTEDDIVKLKDLCDNFKKSETYNNFSKESKRKYNKKMMTKNISDSVLLKKCYRNDEKRINNITYGERLHNYKIKLINIEESDEEQ
jgi:phage/plasmid-associated DNA primase